MTGVYNKMIGVYLKPWVLKHIDPLSVNTIFELGSGNAQDAIALNDYYEDSKVHAFECNPVSIVRCKENLIGHDDINFVEQAVSDINGKVTFYPVTNGNFLASSLYKIKDVNQYPYDQSKISVNATRLDTWMQQNNVPSVDLICADLQGALLPAMRGLGSHLHSVKYIVTELEVKRIYDGEYLYDEVLHYLDYNGFKLVASNLVTQYFGDYVFVRK